MKKLVIGLFILGSFSAMADTITLKGGESIYIGGEVVKCQEQVKNSYADMEQSKLIQLLKAGLGACRIETTDGSNPQDFYYSNYYNGMHVNASSLILIRSDIKKGGCE